MFIVKFLRPYSSIPTGFSFEFDGENGVRLNDVTYSFTTLLYLQDIGVVSITNTTSSINSVGSSNDNSVVAHLVGEERAKVVTAVGEDIENSKFVFGGEYKFYDIENKAWKTSKLKKTASHLGRIVGGFAVPLDATNKKMFNRLEKLNVMYNLGLDRDTCRSITNYYS